MIISLCPLLLGINSAAICPRTGIPLLRARFNILSELIKISLFPVMIRLPLGLRFLLFLQPFWLLTHCLLCALFLKSPQLLLSFFNGAVCPVVIITL
jgi:hypothetical protein